MANRVRLSIDASSETQGDNTIRFVRRRPAPERYRRDNTYTAEVATIIKLIMENAGVDRFEYGVDYVTTGEIRDRITREFGIADGMAKFAVHMQVPELLARQRESANKRAEKEELAENLEQLADPATQREIDANRAAAAAARRSDREAIFKAYRLRGLNVPEGDGGEGAAGPAPPPPPPLPAATPQCVAALDSDWVSSLYTALSAEDRTEMSKLIEEHPNFWAPAAKYFPVVDVLNAEPSCLYRTMNAGELIAEDYDDSCEEWLDNRFDKLREQAVELQKTQEFCPWENYEAWHTPKGKNDDNCLLNVLIEKYQVKAPRSQKVSAKSIRKWFEPTAETNGEPDTSIEKIRGFVEKYKIPFRMWTMQRQSGTAVLEHKPDHKKGRAGLAIIAYNNHCYEFVGKTVANSSPTLKAGVALPGSLDGPTKFQQAEAIEQQAYNMLLRKTRPCFFYQAEAGLKSMSLMYEVAPFNQENRVGVDMRKAFHTATMNASETDMIGVFSPQDDIIQVRLGPNTVISPAAYYWVSEEACADWVVREEYLLCARQNNMLLGFELKYLLDEGAITRDQVTHAKFPSYTTEVKKFRETLQKIQETLGNNTIVRENFALYNGFLGKSRVDSKTRRFQVSKQDAELLKATTNSRTKITPSYGDNPDKDNQPWNVSLRSSCGGEYMSLSNRHLYHWVISQCNLAMMRTHQQLVASGTVGELIRVRVDSCQYRSGTDDFGAFVHENLPDFRVIEGGGKPSKGCDFKCRFQDPEMLAQNVREEIDAWIAQHKTWTGPPGCGKSYLIRNHHGSDFGFAMALTNVCARDMQGGVEGVPDGQTIHSTLQLFKPEDLGAVMARMAGETIWLDEISMVNPWIWSVLWAIGKKTRFFLSGDENQCPPVGDRCADPIRWNSYFFSQIIDTSEKVEEDPKFCRADEALRHFRDAMRTAYHPARVMYNCMERFRDETGKKVTDGREYTTAELLDIDHHLVWQNSYRHRLNHAIAAQKGLTWERLEVRKPTAAQRKAAGGAAAKRKTGSLFKFNATAGLKLRARSTRKGLFMKGMMYSLVSDVDYTSATATIRVYGYDDPAKNAVIQACDLIHFTLGWAITVPASQGKTYPTHVVVHQLYSMLKNRGEHKELAYTAVTRLTKLENLRMLPAKIPLPEAPQVEYEGNEIDGDIDDLGKDMRPSQFNMFL